MTNKIFPDIHNDVDSHGTYGVGGQLASSNQQAESQVSSGGAINFPRTQASLDSQRISCVGDQLAPPIGLSNSHAVDGGAPNTPPHPGRLR